MGKPLTTIALAILASQRHDTNLLRFTTIGAADEEVVIGTETYVAKLAKAADYEFEYGANADASATNLAAEINARTAQKITAYAVSSVGVIVVADEPGITGIACTETLAGANNAWSTATMTGGTNPGAAFRASDLVARTPTAVEVGVGQLRAKFGFEPSAFIVAVRDTNGDVKAWDGAASVDPDDARTILIDNTGAVDWAATDTVTILASE